MLITNNLSVFGSLSLSSVSSTTTSLSAMVLESGLVKSRNLGSMSLKGDNEYLPQISLSFPNIFNLNTSTLNFANQSLTVSLTNQPAKTFLAAPNNLAGTPSFRAILASDIPTLNQNTTGNAATATTLQTPRTLTIGNTGKSFDGSGNVSWSLAEIGAQSILTNPITGTGTTNYLSKFTASGILGNSLIYDNGTNVGIGSTSPLGKLHVVQNDISTVAAIIQGGLFGALIQGGSAISNYALSVTNSSSSSLLYVRGDGNVGIGTGSPSEKLDVNGNVKGTLIKDQYGTLRSQRVITITGNTTLSEIHNGAILHITNTCNITIPTGLGADFACDCYVKGAFIAAFVNGGVTLNSPSGLLLKTDKMATLYSSASNVFNLLGELATS